MDAREVEPVVNPRRVASEVRRLLTRREHVGALAAGLALSAALAIFALAEGVPDAHVIATFLFVPSLACPLAAYTVAVDRERGHAEVAATTPLTSAERLLGRLLGLSVLLVFFVLATAPVLYAWTEPVTAGGFHAAAGLLAWSLTVGLVAVLAGLALGHAIQRISTRAVSAGFGMVLVWLLLAVQRRRVLGWAEEGLGRAASETVLALDPLAWALEADHPAAIGPVPSHGAMLADLLLLAAPLALAVALLALGVQHADIHTRSTERPLPTVALVGVLVTLGWTATLVSFPPPPLEVPQGGGAGDAGELEASLHTEDGSRVWGATTPLTLRLDLAGPANTTVVIHELELTSPGLSIGHELATPLEVTLEPGPEAGRAEVPFEATAHPHRVADRFPVQATIDLDGVQVETRAQVDAHDWRTAEESVLAAAGLPLAAVAGVVALGPRRWNRW